MIDVLKSILKKMNVTALISISHCSYRELFCARVQYIKNSHYYLAESYYTDFWLAPTPLGPKIDSEGCIIVDNIYDVATVREFKSYNELRSARSVRFFDLKQIFNHLDELAKVHVTKIFPDCATLIDIHFSFNPRPCVIATVIEHDIFLGVISISIDGDVSVVTKTSARLDELVSTVKHIDISYRGDYYG